MEAKETFGDGCGRNYANTQPADQNRQDAISRVSAQARGICMYAAQKPKSMLKYVTLDKESYMSTLWNYSSESHGAHDA